MKLEWGVPPIPTRGYFIAMVLALILFVWFVFSWAGDA